MLRSMPLKQIVSRSKRSLQARCNLESSYEKLQDDKIETLKSGSNRNDLDCSTMCVDYDPTKCYSPDHPFYLRSKVTDLKEPSAKVVCDDERDDDDDKNDVEDDKKDDNDKEDDIDMKDIELKVINDKKEDIELKDNHKKVNEKKDSDNKVNEMRESDNKVYDMKDHDKKDTVKKVNEKKDTVKTVNEKKDTVKTVNEKKDTVKTVNEKKDIVKKDNVKKDIVKKVVVKKVIVKKDNVKKDIVKKDNVKKDIVKKAITMNDIDEAHLLGLRSHVKSRVSPRNISFCTFNKEKDNVKCCGDSDDGKNLTSAKSKDVPHLPHLSRMGSLQSTLLLVGGGIKQKWHKTVCRDASDENAQSCYSLREGGTLC